ncbi:CopM family metallochaperone [Paracoccus niistensis]|uniref:DUF305 domain-containing protein n=1 Tax=Paracoccus niistensis TaxID=632935 RepID=A0ABV6I0Y8_9RHOB
MHKFQLVAALTALLAAPAALAQESGAAGQAASTAAQPEQMADLSILPQGCRDAIQQSGMTGMPGMMQGMNMHGMMGGMQGMDEAQTASMEAMMKMSGPMMATHTIKDPDLAFHCGMIAHHAGAIAMAEVELEYGNDEESKAMAQKIIDAQGPEIEEMTAWVEKNTGQK